MGVNPFFEKTVRIQTERGHRVIDTGPYRFVRHPGYLGFFGWGLSTPLLLGSWWAFLPALLSMVSLVIRTALEDRTLREELAGYREYASKVRYRLIPGIW
jgi:protein-S-isoprenylcysteine O-methyltransferase Ste14